VFILAALAGPSLFACEECNDGWNCNGVIGPAYYCIFYIDGGCANYADCWYGAAPSLRSEYRVAAVRIVAPNAKPLVSAKPQPKAVQVVTASR
jgi:hypothetical protein